ncbi:MAG: HAD-IA family hydrolase [Nitrospinaceae bacterium]
MTRPQPRNISLFVYDFDGTLVDTLADIASSVNLALRELGLRPLDRETVKTCVGKGVVMLMTRAVEGTRFSDIPKAVEIFRKCYSEHLVDETDFYPNCRETLEHFSEKTHAIFSNKPADFIERILTELDCRKPFQFILGGDSLENKKPDPQGLHLLMEKFGVSPREVLMVGDSSLDIESGKAAGVHTCAVTYGMGDPEALRASQPDYSIDEFSELKLLFR